MLKGSRGIWLRVINVVNDWQKKQGRGRTGFQFRMHPKCHSLLVESELGHVGRGKQLNVPASSALQEGKNLYSSHPFMLIHEETGESCGIFLLNSNAMGTPIAFLLP